MGLERRGTPFASQVGLVSGNSRIGFGIFKAHFLEILVLTSPPPPPQHHALLLALEIGFLAPGFVLSRLP